MTTLGIQGNLLEVTVVSCNKLKDSAWISRQDPYVCIEYGGNRSRTRTCADGGKNPTFQEKFVYTLIEGLKELNVQVWNSNTIKHDDYIGSGKVQLAKALSQGFDDSTWPLQGKTGRNVGEVRVITQYSNVNKKPPSSYDPTVPPWMAALASAYSAPPPNPSVSYPPTDYGYPPHPSYTPPTSSYAPQPSAPPYPPSGGYPEPFPSYPPTRAYPEPSPSYPPNSAYPPGVHIVKIDTNTSLVVVKGTFDANDLAACINMTAEYMKNKKNQNNAEQKEDQEGKYGKNTGFAYPNVPPGLVYAPQLFNDENPNGCIIM